MQSFSKSEYSSGQSVHPAPDSVQRLVQRVFNFGKSVHRIFQFDHSFAACRRPSRRSRSIPAGRGSCQAHFSCPVVPMTPPSGEPPSSFVRKVSTAAALHGILPLPSTDCRLLITDHRSLSPPPLILSSPNHPARLASPPMPARAKATSPNTSTATIGFEACFGPRHADTFRLRRLNLI